MQPFAAWVVLGRPGVCGETAETFRETHRRANEIVAGLRKTLQVKAHGEKQAERWLEEGLVAAGLVKKDLTDVKGSDPRKLALADLLWKRTTVSQEWIAENLSMRSAANVSQQLRRMNKEKTTSQLPPALQQFLKKTWKSGS
ncbi:MAG: hypothetical protein EOP04_21460 [Proteobacteria bacterium]|nr:MAG: hypothetical protein EOP04_21460 [Pseudomonadota bacterium]